MQGQVKKKYNPWVLRCLFKCGLFCRSTSGLTQHRNLCLLNPANRRPAWTPPTGPVTLSPEPVFPRLDTPQNHHGHISHPHTPGMSLHWYQWTVNGRGVRSRAHPLLNGDVISRVCRSGWVQFFDHIWTNWTCSSCYKIKILSNCNCNCYCCQPSNGPPKGKS